MKLRIFREWKGTFGGNLCLFIFPGLAEPFHVSPFFPVSANNREWDCFSTRFCTPSAPISSTFPELVELYFHLIRKGFPRTDAGTRRGLSRRRTVLCPAVVLKIGNELWRNKVEISEERIKDFQKLNSFWFIPSGVKNNGGLEFFLRFWCICRRFFLLKYPLCPPKITILSFAMKNKQSWNTDYYLNLY